MRICHVRVMYLWFMQLKRRGGQRNGWSYPFYLVSKYLILVKSLAQEGWLAGLIAEKKGSFWNKKAAPPQQAGCLLCRHRGGLGKVCLDRRLKFGVVVEVSFWKFLFDSFVAVTNENWQYNTVFCLGFVPLPAGINEWISCCPRWSLNICLCQLNLDFGFCIRRRYLSKCLTRKIYEKFRDFCPRRVSNCTYAIQSSEDPTQVPDVNKVSQ